MNAHFNNDFTIPWGETGLCIVRPLLPEVTELQPIDALLAWCGAGGDPTLLQQPKSPQ